MITTSTNQTTGAGCDLHETVMKNLLITILAMLSIDAFAVGKADESCISAARADIEELLPYASLVAGSAITVKPPEKVTFYGHPIEVLHYPLAEWRDGAIIIYSDFCDRSSGEQRAILAHEIAHSKTLTPPEAPGAATQPWAKRQDEIAATAWAIAMYRVAGLPLAGLELAYFNKPHGYWAAVQSYPTYPAGQSSNYKNFVAR